MVIRRGRVSEIGKGRPRKKRKKSFKSQSHALATNTPISGRVTQGALELFLKKKRKCRFFCDPYTVWIYLLRKGAYGDFYISS